MNSCNQTGMNGVTVKRIWIELNGIDESGVTVRRI